MIMDSRDILSLGISPFNLPNGVTAAVSREPVCRLPHADMLAMRDSVDGEMGRIELENWDERLEYAQDEPEREAIRAQSRIDNFSRACNDIPYFLSSISNWVR